MRKGRLVRSPNNPSNENAFELRKGPWTLEEDKLLIQNVTSLGEGHWNALAKCSGLKRTGKSCRLRWLNYLKPDVKRGNLSPQEQLLILELHFKWGNRWSKIAEHLPGRTDNEIKNYWRTRVQKQAQRLEVDSNSREFLEAIRNFWIPSSLEKMEQCPSSPLINQQEFLPSINSKQESPRFYSSDSMMSMAENSTNFNDCCHLESNNIYFEESQDMSMSEYEVAEADWFTDQVAGSIDEFWQFTSSG